MRWKCWGAKAYQLTDANIKDIDKITADKEKEIMDVR